MRRRLLIAGRGSGTFTAVPSGLFTVATAPDGGWSWFGDPRAIYHNGYIYIGYVDTSGNVCIRVLPVNSQTAGAEIVLKAALDYDDHVNPSLAVLPNGKLAAWYCRHEPASTTPHQRISTNTLASDPTLSGGFGSETDLDAALGGTSYDYPVPVVDGSRVYLFFRNIPSGSTYNLIRTHSDDNGATWAALTTIATNDTNSGRAYWKIIDGGGFVHFAYTDGSPNTDTTSLYHFAWDIANDTYHESDGTSIGGGLPLNPSDMTPVYTAANTWVWDIALDSNGDPRILHPTWATEFSDHRYRVAKWSGSAWGSTEFASAGGGIDSTGVYSGGMCFDYADPTKIYASRQVSGQWEMYRYIDTGVSFTETALTSSSASKNIRPYAVMGTSVVLWLFGTYTGYSAAFSLGIRGYR